MARPHESQLSALIIVPSSFIGFRFNQYRVYYANERQAAVCLACSGVYTVELNHKQTEGVTYEIGAAG